MSRKKLIDATDLRIMDIMQRNGNITTKELAENVGLSNGAVMVRINNLKKRGVIETETVINTDWLKFKHKTLVQVQVPEKFVEDFKTRILEMPCLTSFTLLKREPEIPIGTVFKPMLVTFLTLDEEHFIKDFKDMLGALDYHVVTFVFEIEERIKKLPTITCG